MKKMKFLFAVLVAALCTATFSSCGDDDDDMTNGSIETSTANIVGKWYCASLRWTEDDYTYVETYDVPSNVYMSFDIDGTGVMCSKGTSSELFEIGCTKGKSFKWYVYKKNGKTWLHTDVYDGQDYRIDSMTSTTLEMTMADEYLTMTCRFVKDTDD